MLLLRSFDRTTEILRNEVDGRSQALAASDSAQLLSRGYFTSADGRLDTCRRVGQRVDAVIAAQAATADAAVRLEARVPAMSGAELKNIVFVPSKSTEESVEFYVNELALFEVAENLGRGNVFLRYIRSEDFYLMLSLELGVREGDAPIFSVGVDDCFGEYYRLKGFDFKSGAEILSNPGFVEWPLGKFLKIRDPAGNVFDLSEWYV
ncbi:VOC family protein [Burkholderia ubonensis]|uniref:VOC family protein n=1 Tax=Burkholderia ubonensis TaxID=101571 RepID=UPI000A43C774|nr:VOC family protein [Burkholderia ubonensis]